MLFEWYGQDVSSTVMFAAEKALREVAADAVAHAQRPPSMGGAPVVTGWLSSNITFGDVEDMENGEGFIIRWGNLYEPNYAVLVALRNPYLQRNADIVYPRLAERVEYHTPPNLRGM